MAATQDKYADSSIGNVTGSNGVNVFLGIGSSILLSFGLQRVMIFTYHSDKYYFVENFKNVPEKLF